MLNDFRLSAFGVAVVTTNHVHDDLVCAFSCLLLPGWLVHLTQVVHFGEANPIPEVSGYVAKLVMFSQSVLSDLGVLRSLYPTG